MQYVFLFYMFVYVSYKTILTSTKHGASNSHFGQIWTEYLGVFVGFNNISAISRQWLLSVDIFKTLPHCSTTSLIRLFKCQSSLLDVVCSYTEVLIRIEYGSCVYFEPS